MRKKDMTKKQLAQRASLIAALAKADWNSTGVNEMFDAGDFVPEEAQMEHHTDGMDLLLEFSAERGALHLYLNAPNGKTVGLVIEYGDQLCEILDLIVAFQDRITIDNYKRELGVIVRAGPRTFVDVPEKGLHRLTVNEEG